jgi:hypothetical protein
VVAETLPFVATKDVARVLIMVGPALPDAGLRRWLEAGKCEPVTASGTRKVLSKRTALRAFSTLVVSNSHSGSPITRAMFSSSS